MKRMDVELEPEVTSWYLALDHDSQDIVFAHVELLEEFGTPAPDAAQPPTG